MKLSNWMAMVLCKGYFKGILENILCALNIYVGFNYTVYSTNVAYAGFLFKILLLS